MKLQFGICDDDISYHEKIETLCRSYINDKNIEAAFFYFTNAEELLDFKDSIDILFLDIKMEGKSGVDILPVLRHKYNISHIIFITSYEEYVQDTFGVKTDGFLSKPVSSKRLYSFLDMIIETYKSNPIIEFQVGYDNSNKYIPANNILYLQGENNFTKVYTNGEYSDFLTYQTISYWENRLSEYGFIRVHKSYIVNLEYLVSVKDISTCEIQGNNILPIGRKYASAVKKSYDNYYLYKLRRLHNANR